MDALHPFVKAVIDAKGPWRRGHPWVERTFFGFDSATRRELRGRTTHVAIIDDRAFFRADYSALELRIIEQLRRDTAAMAAELADAHTVILDSMRTPERTPGGAALRYEATTRIRLRGRRKDPQQQFEETPRMTSMQEKYVSAKRGLLPIDCVRAAVDETPEGLPKRTSVWDWIQRPDV